MDISLYLLALTYNYIYKDEVVNFFWNIGTTLMKIILLVCHRSQVIVAQLFGNLMLKVWGAFPFSESIILGEEFP